jgi:hypothetical protein
MGGDQPINVNDMMSFLNSGQALATNTGQPPPLNLPPPDPNPGIGGSYQTDHPFVWSPSDLAPAVPVADTSAAGAASSGPAAQQEFWNLAFQEGFNAGFSAAQGRTPAQSQLGVHGANYDQAYQTGFETGYQAGLPTGSPDPAAAEVPYGESRPGMNATQAAAIWDQNPALAITLGGVADHGTPGYNTLANMQFHPESIMLASGMSTADPVNNWNQAISMYDNMSRVGGSTPDAGVLLTNMAYAGRDTEFGQAVSTNPLEFYEVGLQVLTASGAGPYAVNAFKGMMGQMYNEYSTYLVTTSSPDLAFNQWLVQNHPDVVASWSSG